MTISYADWNNFFRTTKENNLQAWQLWEKAIELDPQYAEAYASVGVTYYMESIWGWSQDAQTIEPRVGDGPTGGRIG